MTLLLNDIAADPELGGVPFTILRDHMALREGEADLEFRESFATFGVVHPAGDQDLALTPEEYRTETLMTFYSPIPFSLGSRPDADHFTAPGKASATIQLRTKRCDHFRLAYEGRGKVLIMSIALARDEGSERN